jgi:hypothetical protein
MVKDKEKGVENRPGMMARRFPASPPETCFLLKNDFPALTPRAIFASPFF